MNLKSTLFLAAFFLAAGCPEAPLDTADKTDVPTDVDAGDADTDADSDSDTDADTDNHTGSNHTGG